MTRIDTTNAVTIPTRRIASSVPVNPKPNFTILRRLAPSMTGIARKKVNSAATVLDTPIKSAPTIVAPDLEVPGNTPAISWKTPMISAVWYVISDKELIFGFLFLFRFSTIMKAIQNTISAVATQTGL